MYLPFSFVQRSLSNNRPQPGGGGEIAVRNFPAISAISAFSPIFPQFPQFFRNFPQFLGGYRNFYPWKYLIPQFSEGFKITMCGLKSTIFALNIHFFIKFCENWPQICEKNFLLGFGLVWTCIFFGAFSLSTVREPRFFQVPTAISLRKKPQFFRNFSAISAIFPQFSAIFGGVLRPQFPPPRPQLGLTSISFF